MAQRIRKDDEVIVIAGRDKGKSGIVMSVFPKESKAIVKGVHIVRRHRKQTPGQEGGIVAQESKIHLSNLAIKDAASGLATRVGFRVSDDGKKVRFSKRSGAVIDV